MVVKISAALTAALLLAAGIASARPIWQPTSPRIFAPGDERYDGVTYPHDDERFCYMPSSPCDNEHRETN
jgi:hypothetical protein